MIDLTLDFFSTKFAYNFTAVDCNPITVNTGSNEYVSDYRAYYPDDYRIESTIVSSFLNGNEVTKQTDYIYDSVSGLTKEVTTTDSDDNELKTRLYYPDDVLTTSSLGLPYLSSTEFDAIDRLKGGDLHKNGIPVLTETLKGGQPISSQRTLFRDWQNNILLPEFVQTSKEDDPLEDRIQFHDYDTYGNLLEVSKADGTHIVYIWGYNKQYPIAKIENITYVDVNSFVANLQSLSNLDNDRTMGSTGKEGDLRDALTNLRNLSILSEANVTTFTYDPLIGVASITDRPTKQYRLL